VAGVVASCGEPLHAALLAAVAVARRTEEHAGGSSSAC